MPEPDVGINIVLDGKTYELPLDSTSYDLDEAMALTQLTGAYLADIDTVARLDNPAFIAFLVWAAIHREDPTYKVAKVGKLNMVEIFNQIQEAMVAAAPQAGDADPPEVPVSSADDGGVTEDTGTSRLSVSASSESSDDLLAPAPATSGEPG